VIVKMIVKLLNNTLMFCLSVVLMFCFVFVILSSNNSAVSMPTSPLRAEGR